MGNLISCHKISDVSALTVSKQATDCVPLKTKSGDYATESEIINPDVHKTVVTDLNIGDGDLTNLEDIEHEHLINKRTNKENKPRPGLHRQTPPTDRLLKSKDRGVKRAPQCDYLLLPGQVSPKDGSPMLVRYAEKTTNRSKSRGWSYNSTESKNCVKPKRGVCTDQTEDRKKTHQQSLLSVDPQDNRMRSPEGGRSAVTNYPTYQDENSNIVQEGTSGTHQHLTPTDAELTKKNNQQTVNIQTYPKVTVVGYDSRYMATATKLTSLPRKMLLNRTERLPNRHPRRMLSDRSGEFPYSLEEAFQCNVPCSDEILEMSAVTGMPISKLPQAPSGKYPVSFELKVMMRGAGGDSGREDSSVDLDPMMLMESYSGGDAGVEDGRNIGEGSKVVCDDGKLKEGRKQEDRKSPSRLRPLSSDKAENTEDLPKICSQEDTSEQSGEIQPSVARQVRAHSEAAAIPLQSVPHCSVIIADSPGASDAGSTQSTASTDVEHAQNVPREKTNKSVNQSPVKGDGVVEPPHGRKNEKGARDQQESFTNRVIVAADGDNKQSRDQKDKYKEDVEKITKEMKPSGILFNAANRPEARQPCMSYQAIQEAVSLAILKLSNIQTGKPFTGPDDVMELRTENASPQQTDKDPNQSVTCQSVEICSEPFQHNNQDSLQDNSVVSLKAKDASVDETSGNVCINEPADDDTMPVQPQEQESISIVSDMSVQTKDRPEKEEVSPKIGESPAAVKSEDWEIIPLHRVFGQTDLSGAVAPASPAPQESCAATSRSLPPSVGPPITMKEHFQAQKETMQNTLPEEQMISMALSKSRLIAAGSHEHPKSAAAAGDPSRHGEGTLPLKVKPCPVHRSSTQADGLHSRGAPSKASPRHQVKAHEHLQLGEDIFQTLVSESPTQQTASTPELARSLTTSETQSLSAGDNGRERDNTRSGRPVPRDVHATSFGQKTSD